MAGAPNKAVAAQNTATRQRATEPQKIGFRFNCMEAWSGLTTRAQPPGTKKRGPRMRNRSDAPLVVLVECASRRCHMVQWTQMLPHLRPAAYGSTRQSHIPFARSQRAQVAAAIC